MEACAAGSGLELTPVVAPVRKKPDPRTFGKGAGSGGGTTAPKALPGSMIVSRQEGL